MILIPTIMNAGGCTYVHITMHNGMMMFVCTHTLGIFILSPLSIVTYMLCIHQHALLGCYMRLLDLILAFPPFLASISQTALHSLKCWFSVESIWKTAKMRMIAKVGSYLTIMWSTIRAHVLSEITRRRGLKAFHLALPEITFNPAAAGPPRHPPAAAWGA